MQNKKGNKNVVILLLILLVGAGAFVYIRYLKSKLPQTAARSQSPIDIRPLLIAKLQQLVKEGSDGLYNLSIDEINPDVLASRVDIIKARLIPDTAALHRLDNEDKAPDDVFTVSFSNLHITGISIADFLHKKKIDLDTILVSSPFIEVLHTLRPYNKTKREKDSSLSLYQKLTQQFTHISIGAIIVKEATFINTNVSQHNKTTRYNWVDMQVSDLLIDSSTQYDKNRFLFCKTTTISCKDYVARTADSLYLFKVGSFSVSAEKHVLIANNVELLPRGNKEQFEKKLTTRNDMFTVSFPRIVCTNIDWWALANNERFDAEEIVVAKGIVSDYFNRSLPSGPEGRKNNFPQQLLLQTPMKVNIRKLQAQNVKVSYEEYSPQSKQSGTITFDGIDATLNNITNELTQIKTDPFSVCAASGLFMKKVPVQALIRFNLSKPRTGNFSSRFYMAALDNSILNPVAEPIGMFTFKSGKIAGTTVHIAGDDQQAKTSITMLYDDLTIVPLKDPGKDGDLKKKSLVGFFANTFVVKHANPSGSNKTPRTPEVMVQRGDSGSFFNFIWKAVLTGIVKTIGLPKKFANQ